MASGKRILRETADKLCMHFLSREIIAYGNYQGYLFLLQGNRFTDREPHILISFCARNQTRTLHLPAFLPKECRVQKTDGFRYTIYLSIRESHRQSMQKLHALLEQLITVLTGNLFRNCDEYGAEGITEIYRVREGFSFLTGSSAAALEQRFLQEAQEDALKPERFLPGTGGALLGALAASVLIFLVARLGLVISLSSAMMGVGVVYGYKWKGVRLSAISSGICLLIAVVCSYLVFRLDLAFSIQNVLRDVTDISFAEAFWNARKIMTLRKTLYYENLLSVAGIAVLGTVFMLYYALRAQKKQFWIEKMP